MTVNVGLLILYRGLEMYIYRRILRVPWTDKVTNAEVLLRMKKQQELLATLKIRKTEYPGHIMRGEQNEIPRLIIQEKFPGKRSLARREWMWMEDMLQ